MKILVTGFKPFLGESINPSELMSQALQQKYPTLIESLILPVEFQTCFSMLRKKLEEHTFDLIVLLGQAGGREKITVEKFALNWNYARALDEVGFRPENGLISKNANLALMSSLPLEAITEEMRSKGCPIMMSFHAGSFVCNYLYFKTLEEVQNIPAVFVHVPFLPEQAGNYTGEADQKNLVRPSLEYEVMLKAIDDFVLNLVDRRRRD